MRSKSGKGASTGGSLGTGYVTVIMIFVVICLALLAALSFKTVMNNSGIGDASRTNTAAYYAAEESANRRLAELDGAAAESQKTGNPSVLSDMIQSSDEVAAIPDAEGLIAEWSEKITDKVRLRCAVLFYSSPELHDGKRFEVREWRTDIGTGTDPDDVHITVWDGTLF